MNVKISLLCLSVCFSATISMSIKDSIDEQWEKFKNEFQKQYSDDEDESVHKENFKQNIDKIEAHNVQFENKKVSYKLGITQFADLDDAEIIKSKEPAEIINNINTDQSEYKPTYDVTLPPDFDWRQNGIPPKVEDKGDCRSDWAFAAVGMLEGYSFTITKQFTPLSKQDLIDCSKEIFGNYGCMGGNVDNAIDYVRNRSISTEQSYPYATMSQECKKVQRDIIPLEWKISSKSVSSKDEELMKHTLYKKGPLAAKIYAPSKFFLYKEGIFTGEDCESNKVDYNVLIVGYGVQEPEKEYWIVKNWWGQDWGEQGYAKIAIKNSTCGIASKVRQLVSKKDKN